jgi:hypothetical protein
MIQELASLVDLTQSNPVLPAGHPFTNVQSFSYWSATAYSGATGVAKGVLFNNGTVTIFNKDDHHFMWCVRGGQGVDPQ